MSELVAPPTIFEFAPDVPDGVEVFADPNGVRITVAPVNGPKQRFAFIMDSVVYVVFMCFWTGGAIFGIFLSRPLWQKMIPILFVWALIVGLWRLILRKH